MTANQGKITTFNGTGGLVDGTDKVHSGLFKALFNTASGSRVVSSGTFTQSGAVFTLAGTVVYRSLGTKYTMGGGNTVTVVTNSGISYERYDLVYIDQSANALAIAKITSPGATIKVPDIAKEDVPVAIIKLAAEAAADATHEVQLLMSEYNKDVLDDDEVATDKIANDAVTYAKIQNVVNDERVLGRVSGANGVIEELTQAQVLTFLGGVEAGADVTDTANVNAAGAIMHTDIPDSDTGFVKRTGSETYDIDTSTYLTAEADTLQTVTARGATTAIGITNNGYRHYQIPLPAAGLTDLTVGAPPTFSHYYINANAALVVGTNGQVITIKNIDTNPILITHATAFEGGIASAKDQRHTAPDTITLESLETIRLQYLLDSAGVPTATWYITETDTGGTAGIANVVDDTSPQLGGNLDVNSNKITGTIVFDGDVNIEAGHTLRTTTLPVVDINSDPNPLVLDTHAGRYLLCSSNITLPATSTQGDQYFLLNDSGSSISILRNGNTINGAASDATLTSYKGATCIAIGSNNWIVLGV